MKLRSIMFVSVVAFAACGKSKSTDEPAPKASDPGATPAAGSAKAAPAEPTAEAAPPIGEPKGWFNCHAKDPAAVPAKRKPANPWQLPFTFAGCPTVPAEIYGSAAFGMDGEAAAKAAKAKLEETSGYIYLGKSPFRYQFTFRVNEDTKKVDAFTFKVDADAFEEMKAAWGEPLVYEHMSDKYWAWFNPDKHLKVTAHAETWNRANTKTKEDEDIPGYWVYYQEYVPLVEMLGKDGLVGKPVLGKTVAELAAAYPGWLEVKTAAENRATLDKVGLDDKTKKEVVAIGAADDSANLTLPQLETNEFHTLVQPDYKAGKVLAYSFLLSFGKDQALKQELLAVVAAALGKPTSTTKDDANWKYTFAGPNGTVVAASMSTLAEDWSLEVSAKK